MAWVAPWRRGLRCALVAWVVPGWQDKHKVMIEEAQLPILLNLAQASLKLATAAAAAVTGMAGEGEVNEKAMKKVRKQKEKEAKSCITYCNQAMKAEEARGRNCTLVTLDCHLRLVVRVSCYGGRFSWLDPGWTAPERAQRRQSWRTCLRVFCPIGRGNGRTVQYD